MLNWTIGFLLGDALLLCGYLRVLFPSASDASMFKGVSYRREWIWVLKQINRCSQCLEVLKCSTTDFIKFFYRDKNIWEFPSFNHAKSCSSSLKFVHTVPRGNQRCVMILKAFQALHWTWVLILPALLGSNWERQRLTKRALKVFRHQWHHQ